MPKTKPDPRVTKRRVTMRRVVGRGVDHDGNLVLAEEQAVDYVRPDHLDAYVADARKNWQWVEVSEEPDAGPGGYDGATAVPEHLDVPDAGAFYAATTEG
jgi:hypothetical protein